LLAQVGRLPQLPPCLAGAATSSEAQPNLHCHPVRAAAHSAAAQTRDPPGVKGYPEILHPVGVPDLQWTTSCRTASGMTLKTRYVTKFQFNTGT